MPLPPKARNRHRAYRLLCYGSHLELTTEVQKLLAEDWHLFESPSVVSPTCFCQAMVQFNMDNC